MSKTFNKGGQRRTLELGCGWRCVGHPTEVNKKFIIHQRHCKECGEAKIQLPEYSRIAGDTNGWKGQSHKPNSKKETITSVSCNGTTQNITMKDVKPTQEKIVEKILTDEELIALFSL
jgi:hypothetical protein